MNKVFEVSIYGKSPHAPLWRGLFGDEESGARAAAQWLGVFGSSFNSASNILTHCSNVFVRVVEYRLSCLDGRFLYHTSYVWM